MMHIIVHGANSAFNLMYSVEDGTFFEAALDDSGKKKQAKTRSI